MSPSQQKSTEETQITFADLGLAGSILHALQASGYDTPTPIQAQAIPPAMQRRDLLLSAQTGSGKTASFVLPILDDIISSEASPRHIHTVILTPTRELANQVSDSVRQYSKGVRGIFSVPLVGGSPYGGQIRALKKGVQIVIATPGRFIDHLNSGRINLENLQTLILDEADRMLDMGFSEDIEAVMNASPDDRQTIMSSATWDGPVGKIAKSFTSDPVTVSIKVETAHIDETVYYCDDFHHKNNLLDELLNDKDLNQAIIFTATKRSSETLAKSLSEKGHKAKYLHGDLPQGKRNRIIEDVKKGKTNILVATDVAARGIDVDGITHVFNYDLPRQVEDYVHRIGRSGRAGRSGNAVSLCSIDDRKQLDAINRYLKRTMSVEEVDGLEPKKNTKDLNVGRDGKKGRGRGRGRGRGGNSQGNGNKGSYAGSGNRRRQGRRQDNGSHSAKNNDSEGYSNKSNSGESYSNNRKRFGNDDNSNGNHSNGSHANSRGKFNRSGEKGKRSESRPFNSKSGKSNHRHAKRRSDNQPKRQNHYYSSKP